jgi:methyltransferase-like protein 23
MATPADVPPRVEGFIGSVTQPLDPPRDEYHLRLGPHAWTIAHGGALIDVWDEQRYLGEERSVAPYGVALWPASIALAHELASLAAELRGKHVLELGAGTGLPGIVAATFGARVVQTDFHEAVLALGRRNAERNRVHDIEHRLADWTRWGESARYDLILGADVIYAPRNHPHLRAIFESNLAPGGRLLLTDPFRKSSLELLEAMEHDGWTVRMTKWTVEERAVAAYDLSRG